MGFHFNKYKLMPDYCSNKGYYYRDYFLLNSIYKGSIVLESDVHNILIVEDKKDLRDWLKDLIKQSYADAIVHTKDTLQGGIQSTSEHTFQIALIDLGLPDGSGIDLIKILREQSEQCFSVVMTIFDDSEHLFSALKAGAYGYLLKDEKDEDLLNALKGIISGKPPISPKIAQMMIDYFQKNEAVKVNLTGRETEVLTLISKGLSVKKTAELLTMSRYTAADHVKQIYQKLNINSRAEATIKAIDLGLLNSRL